MDSHINNFSNKIREEKYEKGNKFSCFCVSPLRLLKVLTPTPDGLYVAWEKKQLFRKPFQSFLNQRSKVNRVRTFTVHRMDLDKAQGPNAKKWPCFELKPGGLKLAKGIVSSLK
jgi:hypothetical protein